MEPSEEIRRVVERWLVALSHGDKEAVLARLSEHPATLLIGTDPNEWWQGRAVREVWARQIEEMGSYPNAWEDLQAWEEGNFGWASGRLRYEWDGQSYTQRISCVLRLERGEWKVVHEHVSLPQDNEAIGLTITTTLEQLEETLEREKPDLSSSLAVDGTVTIVFIDIVDSTIMLSRLGDHSWLQVVREYHALIEEVATTHGGTVVDTQGDGAMLAFPSVRRAVSCARLLQETVEDEFDYLSPPLRIRAGIHTGDALHEAEQFFGTTVHYAARVVSHAVGGEVLVSSVVRELLAGSDSGHTFLAGRDVELKGLPGQHCLYALDRG
jgi:class 3 adenylate cyclase/ketosteroid isomerase-like protein